MERIIYTNSRGQSISLTNSGPFLLSKLDGTGGPDTTLQMSKGYKQDGKCLEEVLLENRVVTMEGVILADSNEELYTLRQQLCSVFNPKLREGVVIYSNDAVSRQIYAVPEHSPIFQEKFSTTQKFLITINCPSPFWLSNNAESAQLTYLMGGLVFPLKLPTRLSTRTYKKIIANSGDVESPVEIEFYGPATNPTVKNNTTGEYIIVKRELTDTDKLIIATEFGNKRVEIEDATGNRSNAINWIDLRSTFFQLQVGENEIEYSSNNDSMKSKVIIRYRNRYVGV